MHLIPKIGIDNISFGLSRRQILDILGQPDRIFAEENEGEDDIIFQYYSHKLSLTFYPSHSDKLGYIRCSNPSVTLNGKKILNRPIEIIKTKIYPNANWEVEEYDFFDTHFVEELWLTLNVEYGEVTDIEIGVPINSSDEYVWPK